MANVKGFIQREKRKKGTKHGLEKKHVKQDYWDAVAKSDDFNIVFTKCLQDMNESLDTVRLAVKSYQSTLQPLKQSIAADHESANRTGQLVKSVCVRKQYGSSQSREQQQLMPPPFAVEKVRQLERHIHGLKELVMSVEG